MDFETLSLAPDLVRAVNDSGYRNPSPVQAKAIPLILDGHDVLAAAQTGTGKTAAFVLPVLQRLHFVGQARPKQVRALVLTPTRELASQVHDSVTAYGKYLSLRSTVVFGGVKAGPQIATLSKGADLLVATPGRLLDLLGQGAIEFSALEVLVLDEADRMLDMGFIHDIRRIVQALPKGRQTLMFSATFSKEIRDLAKQYLVDPRQVEVAPPNSTAERVEQAVYRVDKTRKADLLVHLLLEHKWHQVLVFTRTKHGANRLCRRLLKEGFEAAPIHGNKSQNARQRALADFKAGQIQVLVATDIAARGLDIDQLPHVVNFDLPAVAEDYVHRIGRTGRAGASGRSHSLVSGEDLALLKAIERLTKSPLRRVDVAGFEASVSDSAAAPDDNNADKKPERPGRRRRSKAKSDGSDGGVRRPPGRRRRRPGNRGNSSRARGGAPSAA